MPFFYLPPTILHEKGRRGETWEAPRWETCRGDRHTCLLPGIFKRQNPHYYLTCLQLYMKKTDPLFYLNSWLGGGRRICLQKQDRQFELGTGTGGTELCLSSLSPLSIYLVEEGSSHLTALLSVMGAFKTAYKQAPSTSVSQPGK